MSRYNDMIRWIRHSMAVFLESGFSQRELHYELRFVHLAMCLYREGRLPSNPPDHINATVYWNGAYSDDGMSNCAVDSFEYIPFTEWRLLANAVWTAERTAAAELEAMRGLGFRLREDSNEGVAYERLFGRYLLRLAPYRLMLPDTIKAHDSCPYRTGESAVAVMLFHIPDDESIDSLRERPHCHRKARRLKRLVEDPLFPLHSPLERASLVGTGIIRQHTCQAALAHLNTAESMNWVAPLDMMQVVGLLPPELIDRMIACC